MTQIRDRLALAKSCNFNSSIVAGELLRKVSMKRVFAVLLTTSILIGTAALAAESIKMLTQ